MSQHHLSTQFSDLLPPLRNLSEEDWDLVSEYSCSTFSSQPTQNTELSNGTGGLLSRVSKHCKGRMLVQGVDDILMHHVVAHGAKSETKDGMWRFEKDGVVVILTWDVDPTDQVELSSLFKGAIPGSRKIRGFVEQHTYDEASKTYAELLASLERAFDDEERLAALVNVLGVDCARILSGIDLQLMPPNRPLLLHCVEKGYVKCVEHLIAKGWNPGVTGSSGSTMLHLAAWTGQAAVLDCLPETVVEKLVDIPNDYHEIPEFTAWSQYCQTRGSLTQESRLDFLRIAALCRNVRLGIKDTTEMVFVNLANEELESLDVDEPTLVIPRGCDPKKVASFFESRSGFRCSSLEAQFLPLGNAEQVCSMMLCSMQGNPILRSIKIESCGLTCDNMQLMVNFLNSKPTNALLLEYLSLSHNPAISDSGCSILASIPHVLHIDTLHLTDIGLTSPGLQSFANLMLQHAAVGNAPAFRLRKLCMGENDFSGEVIAPEGFVNPMLGSSGLATIDDEQDSSQTTADSGSDRNHHLVRLFEALSKTSLTFLDLKETRLKPAQLSIVSCLVPQYLRELETFDIYGINAISAVEDDIREMVRVSALQGRMKRLNVDQNLYPGLWHHCQSCFRGSRGHGKGSKKGLSRTVVAGDQQSSRGGQTNLFDLGRDDHIGRIAVIKKSLSKVENTTAVLRTAQGDIFVKDSENMIASAGLCIGDLVRFKLHYNSQSRCLAINFIQSPPPEISLAPCKDQCHIFLYRYEVKQILLLPARSSAMRQLAERLDLVTNVGPFLEQRFPGSVRKGQERFPSLNELIGDIDCSTFTDEEVDLLAHLNVPESFLDLLGRRRGVNETIRALLQRVSPVLKEMMEHIQDEQKKRASSSDLHGYSPDKQLKQKTPKKMVMVSQPKLESSAFNREEYWMFPPRVKQALANMLQSYFLQLAVTVGQKAPDGHTLVPVQTEATSINGVVEVLDSAAQLKKEFIMVGVAECMLEDVVGEVGKLPQGMVMRPAWLRRQPRWVSVAELNSADHADWRGLFDTFEEQGFPDVAGALTKLVDAFDVNAPGTLLFVRKAEVTEKRQEIIPEETDLGWQALRRNDGKGKSRGSMLERSAGRSEQRQDMGWGQSWRSPGKAGGKASGKGSQALSSSDRPVERHADGRPKLQLKPRTKPTESNK